MDAPPLRQVRRGMLGLVTLGSAGLLAELIVLEHYTDANQLIPVVVAACGLAAALWLAVAPGLLALRFWQLAMLLFVGAGVTGITMHLDVTSETVAPPVLAPGLFVHLGLLGLLFTYRHPAAADPAETHL